MLIGTIEHNKKSPRGIGPRRYSPSPQCVIYVTVTQDTSPGGKAEVCHEDLFGRARTGGLGQVSMKKKKRVLLDAVLTGRPSLKLYISAAWFIFLRPSYSTVVIEMKDHQNPSQDPFKNERGNSSLFQYVSCEKQSSKKIVSERFVFPWVALLSRSTMIYSPIGRQQWWPYLVSLIQT